MSAEIGFADRAVLAVIAALPGTTSIDIRGIAVCVDELARSVEVMFATFEGSDDTEAGIAEFSTHLTEASSSWLAHTTSAWVGSRLQEWPGRHERVLFRTREAADGLGVTPVSEFAMMATLLLASNLGGSFGPEMWGASLSPDLATLTVDVHLAMSRPLDRVDRYEIEELATDLSCQWSRNVLWRFQVWVGDRSDFLRWPGLRHRRVYLQRPSASTVPDDFLVEDEYPYVFYPQAIEHPGALGIRGDEG